jgi:hypothetical protein
MSEEAKQSGTPAKFGWLEDPKNPQGEGWNISPRARLWLERVSVEEGRNPGRILSEIIEQYLEMEQDVGRESVARLLECLVHGPKEALQRMEEEKSRWEQLREKMEDMVDAAKIFAAQMVAERTIEETGEPRFRLKEGEKEILFGEGDPEIR